MSHERLGLLDSIFHYRDVLPTVDHRRLLELVRGFDWPAVGNPPANTYYNLHGLRAQVEIEPHHGEIFDLIHKAHMKMMPHIYKDIGDNLPAAIYDKYSGYWLCKYPEGGYLTKHVDLDGDAGSTTVSFNINDDYEGGELCFWDKHIVEKHANCMHVSPSNHLFMHEVKPITKGTRYSVIVWFSYHKGDQWLT